MHARHYPSIALILGLAVACRGGDPKTDPTVGSADGSADGGADGADGGADGSDGGADGGRDTSDTGDTGAPVPSADPAEALLAALVLQASNGDPKLREKRGGVDPPLVRPRLNRIVVADVLENGGAQLVEAREAPASEDRPRELAEPALDLV